MTSLRIPGRSSSIPASTLRPLSKSPRSSGCSPCMAATRVRAKRRSLVAQKVEAGEGGQAEPRVHGHAGPARDAHRRVQIDERETQYNHQHSESHGGSLAGAAIMVITQMPDRASALVLARSLVESRIAACVSVGAPVESLYHWRGKIETAQEVPVTVKTQSGAVSRRSRPRSARSIPTNFRRSSLSRLSMVLRRISNGSPMKPPAT